MKNKLGKFALFRNEIFLLGFSMKETNPEDGTETWIRSTNFMSMETEEKIVISYKEDNASFSLRKKEDGVSITFFSGFHKDPMKGLDEMIANKKRLFSLPV